MNKQDYVNWYLWISWSNQTVNNQNFWKAIEEKSMRLFEWCLWNGIW